MQSIIKHGKVVRGWLGVTIQDITDDLAKHFDIKEEKGTLVTDVLKDTPAQKAGIKRGDVIVEFDGKSIEDSTDLRNRVAGTLPGDTVRVKVIREGKETVLTVTIGELPGTAAVTGRAYENVLAGVYVQNLTPEITGRLEIPKKITGVIVTNIEEDSPAIEKLRTKDIIQEINRTAIKNTDDYEDLVSRIESDKNILLLVYRAGGYIYVTLSP